MDLFHIMVLILVLMLTLITTTSLDILSHIKVEKRLKKIEGRVNEMDRTKAD